MHADGLANLGMACASMLRSSGSPPEDGQHVMPIARLGAAWSGSVTMT